MSYLQPDSSDPFKADFSTALIVNAIFIASR